jgi:cephalosporin hydroxylase
MTGKRVSIAVACALAGVALGAWGMARFERRPERVIAAYHKWFHASGAQTYNNTRWMGTEVQKSPLDLFVFQEIIVETAPGVIVEAGTYKGGSAAFFASLFDLRQRGRVLTIDIEAYPNRPQHPRITYLAGSSSDPATLRQVEALLKPGERVMVVLDSDHRKDHVLAELRLFHKLVTPGCYLVVEDTHFNGHPILPNHGPGPLEAVEEFLRENHDFSVDRTREKYGMSFNHGGYLRRR